MEKLSLATKRLIMDNNYSPDEIAEITGLDVISVKEVRYLPMLNAIAQSVLGDSSVTVTISRSSKKGQEPPKDVVKKAEETIQKIVSSPVTAFKKPETNKEKSDGGQLSLPLDKKELETKTTRPESRTDKVAESTEEVRPWTAEEDDYVIDNYDRTITYHMADKLKRPVTQIRSRYRFLKSSGYKSSKMKAASQKNTFAQEDESSVEKKDDKSFLNALNKALESRPDLVGPPKEEKNEEDISTSEPEKTSRRRTWTAEEIEILKDTSYSVKELAELFNRTEKSIYAKLASCGIDNRGRIRKQHTWTEEEIEMLRDTSYSIPELAELLNISRNTIYSMMLNKGIPTSKRGYRPPKPRKPRTINKTITYKNKGAEWTLAEMKLVESGKYTTNELAEMLGRTPAAISVKKSALMRGK